MIAPRLWVDSALTLSITTNTGRSLDLRKGDLGHKAGEGVFKRDPVLWSGIFKVRPWAVACPGERWLALQRLIRWTTEAVTSIGRLLRLLDFRLSCLSPTASDDFLEWTDESVGTFSVIIADRFAGDNNIIPDSTRLIDTPLIYGQVWLLDC